MKKKVLTVALVVALIAIVVSSSLAYFTDTDQVTNTFTVGSVKIEIYENEIRSFAANICHTAVSDIILDGITQLIYGIKGATTRRYIAL